MGSQLISRAPLGHFADRTEAGRELAPLLLPLKADMPIVLALPRGGVPVGYPVALELQAPLDVLLVRKLGAPGFQELGIGAVVDGANPQRILNQRIIDAVKPSAEYIAAEEQRQLEVIEKRKRTLRRGRPAEPVDGRTVIVVDDGIATGGTMRVALQALKQAGARRCVVAVPVAPPSAAAQLQIDERDLVCLLTPEDFQAVGQYYRDFSEVSEQDVIQLLDLAWNNERFAPRQGGDSSASSVSKL